MKILIVDDEEDLRDSLVDFFQDEGFEVSTAANGREALERLSDADLPCVMILDLLMPVLDGNQVYSEMQRDPRFSKVPVIVSTSDPSRAPPGLLIMKKPVNLPRLLDTVRQHCPRSG